MNVSADTIHVGPRHEALSPVERIKALMASDSYPALLERGVAAPKPGELNEILKGVAFIVGGVAILWVEATVNEDFPAFGPPIGIITGIGVILIGAYGSFQYRQTVKRYYDEPAELLPVCVQSKDYVSRSTKTDPNAGIYRISFITQHGNHRCADLSTDQADLVAVGDVGVAGLRLERLVDFRVPLDRDGRLRNGSDGDGIFGGPRFLRNGSSFNSP